MGREGLERGIGRVKGEQIDLMGAGIDVERGERGMGKGCRIGGVAT